MRRHLDWHSGWQRANLGRQEDTTAKRKNGRGAVYHRADGRREAQFRLPGIGRKSFYGRTRREVLEKLRDTSWMKSLGLPVSSRNRTAGDFVKDWLEVTRRHVRPSTFRSYELNVRRLTPQPQGCRNQSCLRENL